MRPKLRPVLFGILVFLTVSEGARAQDFLPADGFAAGWKASGKSRTFIEQDLFNHIDGGAELYLEFGFRKLLVQTYASGPSELDFELYEMTEPDAALGIYLMNAGKETPWPEIPVRNSSEDAQVVAIKGRFYLKVNSFAPGAELRPAMISLVKAALALLPEASESGRLSVLPADGLSAGSGRLIRGPVGLQPFYTFGEGDILGLGGKTFAVLGQYKRPDGTLYNRLVVRYASADEAAAVFENLRVNHDPYLTPVAGRDPDTILFSDFQKKYVRAWRKSDRIEILFNLTSLEGDEEAAPFSG